MRADPSPAKNTVKAQSFRRFWDLGVLKMQVKCWWNQPQVCKQIQMWLTQSQKMLILILAAYPIKVFFLCFLRIFLFFTAKLGHFIINDFFYV